jgi:ATP-binding cassette subfamily B protein
MKHKTIWSFYWKQIQPYRWHYLLMLNATIFNSFYPIIYNYALKLFLDRLAQTTAIQDVILPITIFAINELTLATVWRVSSIAEWRSLPYVRKAITLEAYNYTQYHSYDFFQNTYTGLISSKIKDIRKGFDAVWKEIHHGILCKLLIAIISIFSLGLIYKSIALFLTIWAITYSAIVYKMSHKLQRLSYEDSMNTHAIMGHISDRISNIASLFYFTARKQEYEHLKDYIDTVCIPKQKERYKYDFLIKVISDVLYLSMFAVMLTYLLHLKFNNILSIGDFAFIFSMTLVIADKIWHFTMDSQEFSQQIGDLKSAFSLLQEPQTNLDASDAELLHTSSPDIVFKDVSFQYEASEYVLKNLNLTIKAGEKIGLVGQSGAGKSTIVKLLLQFFDLSSGSIMIGDQPIGKIGQESLRSHIAVIPQDTMLFHRSIIDNIRYGRQNATFEEIIEASKKAHIHDIIMNMPEQYETIVGERGIKLSGGQRQRIAIARAILKNAPMIILDEATSSLDSQTENQIQESLEFFIKDSQKTVIAIAHRLSTLKHMDRIIILDEGTIVEEGTHDELMKRKDSLYKKLWEYQQA